MASLYSVQTGSVALSASATKSLLLLNPVTDGIRLTEVSIGFDGSAAGQSIRVDLYRTTTVGSPAGTTGTVVKVSDPNSSPSTTTALTALTAEPTAVEIIKSWFVTPFGGLIVLQFPLGREPGAAAAGNRLGLRCVTPAAVSPNALAYAEFEEQ